MTTSRRIRFATDFPLEPAKERIVAARKDLAEHIISVNVKSDLEKRVAVLADRIDDCPQDDFVVGALLAQQRAHDAMMMARAVQRDIRRRKIRRPVVDSDQSEYHTVANSAGKREHLEARTRPDHLKEADFLSVSMTWLSNTFNL